MASAGYKKTDTKKQSTARADNIQSNISPRGFRHENKAYLCIIVALEASNWYQITFCILKNVLTSISERFCPNFDEINIRPRATPFLFAN